MVGLLVSRIPISFICNLAKYLHPKHFKEKLLYIKRLRGNLFIACPRCLLFLRTLGFYKSSAHIFKTNRFSSDAGSLLYVVQQQPLGSIQWSVVASNLRETNYTVTSLSKGVRYAFRILTSTGKTLSKPSASTDLVQLLDRGDNHEKLP